MKSYGPNKATEFTKKQINVIYGKAKGGELHLEKWLVSRLYDMADFYGQDYSGEAEREERYILRALEQVFSGNVAAAQETLDNYKDSCLNSFTTNYLNKLDRTII